MVYIHPPLPAPLLTAYLLPSFPADQLEPFKRAFELGTHAPFAPMLELILKHAPASYEGQSHEYMRRQENEAGREEPFIVIDEQGAGGRDGIVWYVGSFATELDVTEAELATSTDVLWKIPVKTDCLPLMHINYELGNMGIEEDLGHLGVEFPVAPGYVIRGVENCAGIDIMEERSREEQAFIALPGEYEVSTDRTLLETLVPVPEKVGRLKEGLAEGLGLINRWTAISDDSGLITTRMPDGSEKTFPEGSVRMISRINIEFDWPPYQWPEGSLYPR
ncbi:hypothetical protein F5Y03DRAFT_304213 [Xylaria venustula]|nr:hypothetical protein F5Y03DRAFT_304213 [Xylaria venustula]